MYKRVTQRHDRVVVIGGGPSLAGFDFHRLDDFKGAIITVNNVIRNIPRADYWLTIDMAWGEPMPIGINPRCCYYAGTTDRYMPLFAGRDVSLLKRVPYFAENKLEIIGRNSGLAAVNLGFHMEPRKMLLLGLDILGAEHWYNEDAFDDGSEKAKKEMAGIIRQFDLALPILKKHGCLVANGSPQSAVRCFPRMTIEEGLKWIKR